MTSSNPSIRSKRMGIKLQILGLILLAGACDAVKFSQREDKNELAIKQIHSITYGSDPDAIIWFKYDERGNIINHNIFLDTMHILYTNDHILAQFTDKSKHWNASTKYLTETNGRILESIVMDEKDREISHFVFEYDEEGYLIKTDQKAIDSGKNFQLEYEYSEGNLYQIRELNQEGEILGTYVFEYNKTLPNLYNINPNNFLADYFTGERTGRKNRHLISQMINLNSVGDTLSMMQYTYPKLKERNKLIQIQADILNEFELEVIWHLK